MYAPENRSDKWECHVERIYSMPFDCTLGTLPVVDVYAVDGITAGFKVRLVVY